MQKTLRELRQTKNTVYIGVASINIGLVLALLNGMPLGVAFLIIGGMVMVMGLNSLIYLIGRAVLEQLSGRPSDDAADE